jgi:uncharacterized damage-inducible protein DinB
MKIRTFPFFNPAKYFYFWDMKTYFIRLFNYDHYANELFAGYILKTGLTGRPVQLMAHLLAAQQVWLSRCQALPAPVGGVWPDWPVTTFGSLVAQNSGDWLRYLETLQPEDFDRKISYKNLKGEAFDDTLDNILAHVVNHGTHHRAQIGQYLKEAGVELPYMDYIFYIRTLNN